MKQYTTGVQRLWLVTSLHDVNCDERPPNATLPWPHTDHL